MYNFINNAESLAESADIAENGFCKNIAIINPDFLYILSHLIIVSAFCKHIQKN